MRSLLKVIIIEYKTLAKDWGALLVLVGALFLYSALYGLIYAPEVVREIPVAVVDRDNTEASRHLVQMLNATPQAEVKYGAESIEQARELFMERKVMGVMYIPEGFERTALGGGQSHISVYADGSYFLLYGAFLNASANVVIEEGKQIQVRNFTLSGIEPAVAKRLAKPLEYKIEMLHNPYGGYAAAIMPAVLIVILQQVIMIGLGMVLGSRTEFNQWRTFRGISSLTITLGTAISYFLMYIPLVFYLFWINYSFFDYPWNGQTIDELLFLLPYLLSVIFAAIAFGALFRRRESAVLYLAVFSVFFIMISGVTWPREGMADWLYIGGRILPSSSAIEGWASLRTAGNTLADVTPQWLMLWFLTVLYGAMAFISVHYARKRLA